MQDVATSRDGKCLSEDYINSETKLHWQCKKGHEWWATPHAVKVGKTWCPICGGSFRLDLKQMQKLAESRGGKCLSEKYINTKTKLLWQCAEGHEWEAQPSDIITKKSWCPYCAGRPPVTIEEMQVLAKSRGGLCLSEKYISTETKLLWQCAEGHRWKATPAGIKRGNWCAVCSGRMLLTLQEMQELARSRGGKCLSEEYGNGKTKLHWQCAKGHEWWATPSSIKYQGSWCLICANRSPGTIEEMQELAESRGGKCLSKEYINADEDLIWQCYRGHEWLAAPSRIKHQGSWCPECSAGTGEKICRAFFEQLFDESFPKARPDWLRNARGNRMELDGYNEDLQLAFEHQGKQHFSLTYTFIDSDERLSQRITDDELKKKLCEERGIALLQVPEIPSLLPIRKVKQFIKDECLARGIKLPNNFDEKEVNFNETYNQGYLEEIQKIAESHGGTVLSETFIHSKEKVHLRCSKGHEWWTVASSIKAGRWCLICSGSLKLTIEEMQKIAESHDGKCLSEKYTNLNTKLLWRCAKGHEWWALPLSVRNHHTWCLICAGKSSGTIQEMQKLAESRGGKCLSNEYINTSTKLLWRCSMGHEWQAIPGTIKRGSWCPICSYANHTNKVN